MPPITSQKFRLIALILSGLTAIILIVLKYQWISSELVEGIYRAGVYSLFRTLWDYSVSLLPFPLIYIWIMLMVCLVVFIVAKWRRRFWTFVETIWFLIIVVNAHVLWFYGAWAINYNAKGIEQLLQLNGDVNPEHIVYEYVHVTDTMCWISRRWNPTWEIKDEGLEDSIRPLVYATAKEIGLEPSGNVRCRIIKPDGGLLLFGAGGVYWPFVSEGHIDGGLHAIQKPFTMAHEMFHGIGITEESACNFLAYLACNASKNPYIRYCGMFGYWRYLRRATALHNPEYFKYIDTTTCERVKTHLTEVVDKMNSYPEIFPTFRNWFYDHYLKFNNIPSGSKSYDEMVNYVILYRRKNMVFGQH